MNSGDLETKNTTSIARQIAALVCLVPLWNCFAAASMGVLVVYSDADEYKVLAGVLSAANVGGWIWWVYGSLQQLRQAVQKKITPTHHSHPGFRLAGLISFCVAVSWVGVLFLLAYGMLA
ncbi:MAG: hypothetical protein JST84_16525 [Acidobacteria bacterium]|nr:hypothetical protein [Acidobacteriota bacterium]